MTPKELRQLRFVEKHGRVSADCPNWLESNLIHAGLIRLNPADKLGVPENYSLTERGLAALTGSM